METALRRKKILETLRRTHTPVSASALASKYAVTRQIIVSDIALLRASGCDIASTPRGYMIPSESYGYTCQIACCHSSEKMKEELYTIVDQGCTVNNVIVEHPIYGQLTGSLQLSSRYDVDLFIKKCRAYDALPLSYLTEGIHLHTITCRDEDSCRRVKKLLDDAGILLNEKES